MTGGGLPDTRPAEQVGAVPRRRGSSWGAAVRWVLKPLAWVGCLAPAGWLVRGLLIGDLGADPVKTLTHTTGLSALIILFVSLSVTPIRRLAGIDQLIRLRRPIGLFAFFYATVHLLIYAVFDHRLAVGEIAEDIVKHPWVLVGFAAFLILLVLAVTSPAGMVRRLGAKRWTALHRLVYLAPILGVLHFLWLVKKDTSEPVRYGVILAVILLSRLVLPGARRRKPGPATPE